MLHPNRLIDFDGNRLAKQAFEQRFSNIHTVIIGKVTKIYDDDVEGTPHQRFVLQLPGTEQTILVAHNLLYGERLHVAIGDVFRISGEYVWNRHGGMIHATHHDPMEKFKEGSAEILVETHPNPQPTARIPAIATVAAPPYQSTHL
ncbi:DUF3465 domain-containing protein [candidate division WWE3 bacterium]|nr:DUF3465 domain-containing protein [candidate division WWE3 bacterium]